MTRCREVDINVTTTASPEVVFNLLADGATWPSWSPIESFVLERAGDRELEGVGAIRVFRRGRVTGRDEIVEVVPSRRFAYASLSGLPVRDYVGTIDIAPMTTGASIRWRATFQPKIPGTGGLLERGIRRFLADCAKGLAEYSAAPAHARSERAGP